MKYTERNTKPVDPEFCRLHDLLLSRAYQPRPYSVEAFLEEHVSYGLDLEAKYNPNGFVEEIVIKRPH